MFRISKFPLRCHQLKQESLLWDRKLILSLSKSLLLCTPQVSRFELNFLSHLLYWLVSAVFLCPPVSSVYCFVGFHHNDCVFLDVPSGTLALSGTILGFCCFSLLHFDTLPACICIYYDRNLFPLSAFNCSEREWKVKPDRKCFAPICQSLLFSTERHFVKKIQTWWKCWEYITKERNLNSLLGQFCNQPI